MAGSVPECHDFQMRALSGSETNTHPPDVTTRP